MLPAWTEQGAYFSDPLHRVWLRRRLGGSGPPIAFILHNPSYAAEEQNDPTARRGIGFASAEHASDLIFVNAATGIATDADDLAAMADPIGTMADEAIQVAADFVHARGGYLVAAWGAPKGKAATRRLLAGRFEAIKAMGIPLRAMRITASGHPEHLLYLPARLRPLPWRAGRP